MYEIIKAAAKASAESATVCLVFSEKTLYHRDQDLDARSHHALATALKRADLKCDAGEFTTVHSPEGRPLAILGLGKRKEFSREKLTVAAAGLVKGLSKLEATSVTVSVPIEVLEALHSKQAERDFATALGEGVALGNFKFNTFKKPSEKPHAKALSIFLDADERGDALASGLAEGLSLGESVNFARSLAATPPNVATTSFIASEAQKLARESKDLKCAVLRGNDIAKYKLVGLDNVGKASENPPCLIEISYTPKSKSAPLVLLVGKTLCYDTGGLSIKSRENMKGMKYDKCGGMAVLGAMRAIVRLKPDVRVVALMPCAENSISNNAVRVDDIIRYPNGVSVEVTNTDAEGRLVLADALIYGCSQYKPAAIVDLATLTGGVVVGLGRTFAGYWCEDEALRNALEQASRDSGDRIWRLPMHEDYKEMMKAKHADLWNSAPVRDAHPIQGAAFLSNFVDPKIPWAHVDIAGTADLERDKAPFRAGPTGFGVRLLVKFVEHFAGKGK